MILLWLGWNFNSNSSKPPGPGEQSPGGPGPALRFPRRPAEGGAAGPSGPGPSLRTAGNGRSAHLALGAPPDKKRQGHNGTDGSFRIKATEGAQAKPQTGEQRRGRKELGGNKQSTRSLRNQWQQGRSARGRALCGVPAALGMYRARRASAGEPCRAPTGNQERPRFPSALLELALEFCCENQSKTNNSILPRTKIKLGHRTGRSKGLHCRF